MIRTQSTRLTGRQPHRDVLRGAAHFSRADNQRCCGYGQGVSRSDWAISTINIIDHRLVRAHDAAREDHIVLSLSLHSSLLVYSLFPPQPTLHDGKVAEIAPDLHRLQPRLLSQAFVLDPRALLSIDKAVHLQIQPAGWRVSPVRQQRLRSVMLAVASRLSFPGCTVRWTHHVLADEQLALRCHSRGTRLEDLHGLHIRPVVDNVAEEVDLRFLDRGLFEEVQGGKRGNSGIHKLGKVVNEVLSRQISFAMNQTFGGY